MSLSLVESFDLIWFWVNLAPTYGHRQFSPALCKCHLTVLALMHGCLCAFANSVEPDQLASEEAN